MKKLTVPVDADALDKMAERERKLTKWLKDTHGQQVKDARHLDEGTAERAYWHLGYLTALRDALRLLQKDQEQQRLAS